MKREKPNKPALEARDLIGLKGLLKYNKIIKENIRRFCFIAPFHIQKEL